MTRKITFLILIFMVSSTFSQASLQERNEWAAFVYRRLELLSVEGAMGRNALLALVSMDAEDLDAFIAKIDTLLGIDRNSLAAWLPPMLTKIRTVDAFKKSIEKLQATARGSDPRADKRAFTQALQDVIILARHAVAEKSEDQPLRLGLIEAASLKPLGRGVVRQDTEIYLPSMRK